jgi:hypothetical protein
MAMEETFLPYLEPPPTKVTYRVDPPHGMEQQKPILYPAAVFWPDNLYVFLLQTHRLL